ncbi:MAG: hypothetical protein HC905_22275 [Bacteroidales bacterium]|nr:hypothetical protein [Bacteroidales bacterium]
MSYITIKNNQVIPLADIPVLEYGLFLHQNTEWKKNHAFHCVNYFGKRNRNDLTLYCCMANEYRRINLCKFFYYC